VKDMIELEIKKARRIIASAMNTPVDTFYFAPESLPVGWKKLRDMLDGAMYKRSSDGMTVITSGSIELDDKRWAHVSMAHRGRVPSYGDMVIVKNLFIGRNKRAIQLFVDERDHVNLHPYCLHLWHCLDEDGIPDFTRGTGSI